MQAMAIMNSAEIAPAQEIGQQLFNSFIAFVDRTERTAKTNKSAAVYGMAALCCDCSTRAAGHYQL